MVSEPNCMELEKGLNDVEDFVVIQEPFLNETARFADVIFPGGGVCREGRDVHQLRAPRPARAQGCRAPRAGACRLGDPGRSRAGVRRGLGARKRLRGLRRAGARRAPVLWHQPCAARRRIGSGQDRPPMAVPDPRPSRHRLPPPGRGDAWKGAVPGSRIPALGRTAPTTITALVLSTGRTLYHYNAATQTRRSKPASRAKQPEAYRRATPTGREASAAIDGRRPGLKLRHTSWGRPNARPLLTPGSPRLHLDRTPLCGSARERRYERRRRPGHRHRRVQGLRSRGRTSRGREGRRQPLPRQLLRGRWTLTFGSAGGEA